MKEKLSKEIGSRIKELIFQLHLNQSSFAKSVGVSQNAIFNTVSGNTTPRYELLDNILKVYPQLNRDWLFEGKGEMFNNNPAPALTPDGYLQEHLKNLEKQFAEMREMFSAELNVKNRQIEKLMDLLGKPECVTETGVLEHPATAAMLYEELGQRA